MGKLYKIATRGSNLALIQVEEIVGKIRKIYPDFKAEKIVVNTIGDMDKKTPLSKMEGTDFFTREIDRAILAGKADFAVHSAKDLPDELDSELETVLVTSPMEQNDALVSKDDLRLDELPQNAKIGTSSIRRKKQLYSFSPDFYVTDIRGNIEERIYILDNTDLDAIVIAKCALVRLGLRHRISQTIPLSIIAPHQLQGSLAVVIRKDNYRLKNFFQPLKQKEGSLV